MRAGGSSGPFAILMIDLDAFKAFNDTRGHPAGDALLTAIARAMSAAIRDGDRIYRYGGDEFAAILPGADRMAAHDVAERLRCTVASRPAATPRVSISVGVSCYPEDGRDEGRPGRPSPTARCTSPSPRPVADGAAPSDDPYLRALDETALALLDRRDGAILLETILTRACALLGYPPRLHLHRGPGRPRAGPPPRLRAVRPGRRPPPAGRQGIGGQVF